MELGKLVSEYREAHGLSLREFGERCGLSHVYISYLEKGVNPKTGEKISPTVKQLKKLSSGMGVTLHELLSNTDDIDVRLSSPEVSAEYYRYRINDIAAGYDHIAIDDWEADTIDIPPSYLKGRRPEDFFVLRVVGDSMYPHFQEGDIVLALRQETLNRSGEIGVVIYDDENATLKKVEYVMGEDWMKLIPLNQNYPPIMVTGEHLEHCRVLGIPKMVIRHVE